MFKNAQRQKLDYLAPVLASIFVVVFALVRGAKDSMWLDETFSYLAMQRSFLSLLRFIATEEANMGPYYLILWPWSRINGSDTWIRLLSAFGTVAALWAVWVIVRKWSGPVIAAAAVSVFSLTPFVLAWSIQARSYTMAMAFTAWSLVFADRLREKNDRWSGALFGLMAGFAIASQFATVFVIIGIGIAVLAVAPSRSTARALVMVVIAASIVLTPFLSAALIKPKQANWVPDLTLEWFQSQTLLALSGPLWAAFILISCIGLLVGFSRNRQLGPYWLAVAGAISGIAGLVLVSLVVRPMYVDRYLIGCLPLLVVAAAGGWNQLFASRPLTSAMSIIAIAVIFFSFSLDMTRPLLENYRGAAEVVTDGFRPTDSIVAAPNYRFSGIDRYLSAGKKSDRFIAPSQSSGSWKIRTTSGRDVQPRRIWLVIRGVPPIKMRDWIDETYPIVVIQQGFGDITLQLRTVASI